LEKKSTLKILIVSQYFWPENFRINSLAEELVLRGHDVTVLTGKPNYPDGKIFKEYKLNKGRYNLYKGARVIRVPIIPRGENFYTLFLNYSSFCFTASVLGPFYLRRQKFEKIFIYQTSPITVAVPGILLKYIKKSTLIMWVLDIWPDSLKSVGVIKSKKLLGLINFFVKKIYSFCDYILVQSKGFKKKISKSYDKNKIVYFPGWSELEFNLSKISPAPEFQKTQFTVLFAGNIGIAQDFKSILKSMILLRDKGINWVVLGGGREFNWLKDQINQLNLDKKVFLLGNYPLKRMPSFFKHADALLITLTNDPIHKITVPAKLQVYSMAGKPLLGMIDGEVNNFISKYELGFACKAGDYKGLSKIILKLSKMNREEIDIISKNNIKVSKEIFNKKTMVDLIEKLN
jgi:colanic acid biosynthesis glycosyl transferase WcaI